MKKKEMTMSTIIIRRSCCSGRLLKQLLRQFCNNSRNQWNISSCGIINIQGREISTGTRKHDNQQSTMDPKLSKATKIFNPYSDKSSTAASQRKYTPRRAIMYVPGDNEKKQSKIPTLNVDSVVLDCEDGVAINKKDEARNRIRQILDTKCINFGRSECTVRINSVDSGLAEDDLECILEATNLPATIHLPKVDFVDHLHWFTETTSRILKKQKSKAKLNLILFIESAQGMLALPEICKTAWQLSIKSHFTPDALVFGSDDYIADIGATRTTNSTELLYARQHFVMVAKAFKLQAIDMVHIDFKNTETLRQQCLEGVQFGFTGKQIIHPNQIQITQECFSPTPERIQWAQNLLEAFDKSQEDGHGAMTFNGQMIDMPLVLQAKNILFLKSLIDEGQNEDK